MIFSWMICSFLNTVLFLGGKNKDEEKTGLYVLLSFNFVFNGILLLPLISAGVRRLHDTGKSGWYILLLFIPFVDFILLYFYALDSDKQANRYGPSTKYIYSVPPFAPAYNPQIIVIPQVTVQQQQPPINNYNLYPQPIDKPQESNKNDYYKYVNHNDEPLPNKENVYEEYSKPTIEGVENNNLEDNLYAAQPIHPGDNNYK